MGRSIYSGPISSKTKETDGSLVIHGSDFYFPSGTWTLTRSALGNYFMRKTAGAATTNPFIPLNFTALKIGADPNAAAVGIQGLSAGSQDLHDIRGYQITGFDLIYAIGTAGLTSLTPSLVQTVYANNIAPAVGAAKTLGGGAPTVATNAQPYVFPVSVTTPYVIGNNVVETLDYLELAVVDPGTSVFDLYAVVLKFNYNIL